MSFGFVTKTNEQCLRRIGDEMKAQHVRACSDGEVEGNFHVERIFTEGRDARKCTFASWELT